LLISARDIDRLRLIKRVASSYKFTCQQVVELVKIQRFGEASVQTAVLCYPNLVDPESFLTVVVPVFPYQEDKVNITTKLGL
jgi:hypothetical protein